MADYCVICYLDWANITSYDDCFIGLVIEWYQLWPEDIFTVSSVGDTHMSVCHIFGDLVYIYTHSWGLFIHKVFYQSQIIYNRSVQSDSRRIFLQLCFGGISTYSVGYFFVSAMCCTIFYIIIMSRCARHSQSCCCAISSIVQSVFWRHWHDHKRIINDHGWIAAQVLNAHGCDTSTLMSSGVACVCQRQVCAKI